MIKCFHPASIADAGTKRLRLATLAAAALTCGAFLVAASPALAVDVSIQPGVTANVFSSCGVTVSGEGLCWGPNNDGQTNVPSGRTWAQITPGNRHACGVTTSGEGLCWGNADFGATTVPGSTTWKSITAGYYDSCGVTSSGAGYCWGADYDNLSSVPGGHTWSSITVGNNHACGITTSGGGVCWGTTYEYTNNTVTNDGLSLPAGRTWASLSPDSTGYSTCGVTTSGEGLCWGDNTFGQLNVPSGQTWTSIKLGDYTACGLTTSGDVYCWGTFGRALHEPSGRKWTSVSAGRSHACGVTTAGIANCWGDGGSALSVPLGRIWGTVDPMATDAIGAVLVSPSASPTQQTSATITYGGEAGTTFECSTDNTTFTPCDSSPVQLTDLPAGIHNYWVKATNGLGTTKLTHLNWTISASISAGGEHSCGLTTAGLAVCWGDGRMGQTNPPTYLTFASVSAGSAHSCGVTTSGRGACWGMATAGDTTVPTGKTWSSISAGSTHTCGVTRVGEGICWGENTVGQRAVPAGKTWASISAGTNLSCGVTTLEEALCWGNDQSHQLTVPTGKTWASVSAGDFHACGVTTSGEGICWGDDQDGQSTVPTGKTWASISAGNFYSCGVTTDNEGICWGNDFEGMASVPTSHQWLSIDTGENHTCGVTGDGEGLCWGSAGYYAKTTVPTGKLWGAATTDTTAPEAPMVFSTIDGKNATVDYGDVEDGVTFTCSTDDVTYSPCTGTPVELTSLANGTHHYYVKATDDSNNTSTAGSTTWTIEPTLTVELTSLPDDAWATNLKTATIAYTGEAGATFECSTDDATYAPCSGSPIELTDLTAGDYSYYVRETDSGGIQSTPRGVSWTVQDLTPTAPTLDSGTGAVDKGSVVKSSGWDLAGAADTTPDPSFAWQRCTTPDTPADCSNIVGSSGANGAWWGTRDADVGYQLRVAVSWTTLEGVESSVYSALTGAVRPAVITAPSVDLGLFGNPVKGTAIKSSFGTWNGWIPGASTATFKWQSCSSLTDTSTCADLVGRGTGQWYRPTANDVGAYLRVKARVTTRGQSATAYTAISNMVTAFHAPARRAHVTVVKPKAAKHLAKPNHRKHGGPKKLNSRA